MFTHLLSVDFPTRCLLSSSDFRDTKWGNRREFPKFFPSLELSQTSREKKDLFGTGIFPLYGLFRRSATPSSCMVFSDKSHLANSPSGTT